MDEEFLKSLSTVELVPENDVVQMEISDFVSLKGSLKRFLVEMKMHVDKWDLVVSHFIFHSSIEPIVKEALLPNDAYQSNGTLQIWGSIIYFTDFIPQNHVFAVDLKNNKGLGDTRYISKGLLPDLDIKRALALKAFW